MGALLGELRGLGEDLELEDLEREDLALAVERALAVVLSDESDESLLLLTLEGFLTTEGS